MKNTTRREMLAKLGASAAALTTVAVAGVAAAQTKMAPIKAPTRAILASKARNQFKVTTADATVQLTVGIDKQGVVVQSKRITVAPKLGLTSDRKLLQLGLKIKGGNIEVLGLNSILNPGSTAAEGRCTMRTDPGADVVLPGVDMTTKLNQLSKF